MARISGWVVLGALAFAGCGDEGLESRVSRETAADQARIQEEAPRTVPRGEPTERVEPTEPAEPARPEATADLPEAEASRVDPRDLEGTVELMEAAMAAADGSEVGASYCDAAYQSIAAMVEVVRVRYPDRTREMPPEGLFLDACRRLPDEAQQCLIPTHAMENRQDCARIQAALPPADLARLQNVLEGA